MIFKLGNGKTTRLRVIDTLEMAYEKYATVLLMAIGGACFLMYSGWGLAQLYKAHESYWFSAALFAKVMLSAAYYQWFKVTAKQIQWSLDSFFEDASLEMKMQAMESQIAQLESDKMHLNTELRAQKRELAEKDEEPTDLGY